MISIINKIIIILLCCLFLSGCKEHNQTKDIDKYVAQIKKQKTEPMKPLPQFLKVFERSVDMSGVSRLSSSEQNKKQCRLTQYSTNAFSIIVLY